ncbi:hypothetical protein RRG08_017120, partial [Elysia crispata]
GPSAGHPSASPAEAELMAPYGAPSKRADVRLLRSLHRSKYDVWHSEQESALACCTHQVSGTMHHRLLVWWAGLGWAELLTLVPGAAGRRASTIAWSRRYQRRHPRL